MVLYRDLPRDALRRRIKEIACIRIRCGRMHIHVLLPREGRLVNHKVRWLYCEWRPRLRSKRPRGHVSAAYRQPRTGIAQRAHEKQSMDFVTDQLADGE
jgi:putative transposase